MPVTRNGYYNDPSIGQAAESIASIFAPPSQQDRYAAAKTAETQQKVQALAEYYRNVNNPNVPMDQRDRAGVALGLYAPTQSYYSVDESNKTSRANNAADNATRVTQTGMQQRGETDRAMLNPVAAGATRFVPPAIADMYKVGPTQIGAISAQPGVEVTLPDNRVIKGAPKPMTDSEVKGKIIQGLPENEQRVVALGNTPIQPVLGKDGKPTIAFQADSIGMQPAPKPNEMTDISRLIMERDSLPADDPNRAAYNARIAALGRGQQQSAYDKKQDESFAALNDTIYNTAQTSFSNKASIDRMKQLISDPNIDTGKLADFRLEARKTLEAFGVDAGDVSDEELLRALGSQFALKLRDPSQGAGMPGAMSDADRNFLLSLSPGLKNSREGNLKLIEFFSRVNERNVEIERLRQQYIKQYGRIDEGFRTAVTDFADANPLFADQVQPASPTPAAQGGSMEGRTATGANGEKIIFRGGQWQKL